MASNQGIEERLKAAIADRYRIEREIGSGGMATVYLAENPWAPIASSFRPQHAQDSNLGAMHQRRCHLSEVTRRAK